MSEQTTTTQEQIEALTREILSVAINATPDAAVALSALLSAYLNVAKAAGVLAVVPSVLADFAKHPAIVSATQSTTPPIHLH